LLGWDEIESALRASARSSDPATLGLLDAGVGLGPFPKTRPDDGAGLVADDFPFDLPNPMNFDQEEELAKVAELFGLWTVLGGGVSFVEDAQRWRDIVGRRMDTARGFVEVFVFPVVPPAGTARDVFDDRRRQWKTGVDGMGLRLLPRHQAHWLAAPAAADALPQTSEPADKPTAPLRVDSGVKTAYSPLKHR